MLAKQSSAGGGISFPLLFDSLAQKIIACYKNFLIIIMIMIIMMMMMTSTTTSKEEIY